MKSAECWKKKRGGGGGGGGWKGCWCLLVYLFDEGSTAV